MKMVKLDEISNIIAGQSPPSSTYNRDGKGLPFFQGKADFGLTYPSVRIWCNNPKKIAENGDILISVRAPVGSTNLCNTKACIGRGLSAIRTNSQISNYFLLYYLRFIEKKILSIGKGSTFKAITQDDLQHIEVPLPSVEEQEHIVSSLDLADNIRQKRKQAINLLDEYLKSVFEDLFDKCITQYDTGTTELRSYIKVIGGYAFKSTDFVKDGIPVIKIGTVNKGFFDLSACSFISSKVLNNKNIERFRVIPGELLISLTGTVGKEDYGNICEATPQYPNYLLNQRVAKIDYDNNTFTKEFLFFFFKNKKVKSQLTKISRGVRQANISNEDILKIRLVVPDISKQIKFSKIVQDIMNLKEKMSEQSEELDNQFQAFMQKSFSVN